VFHPPTWTCLSHHNTLAPTTRLKLFTTNQQANTFIHHFHTTTMKFTLTAVALTGLISSASAQYFGVIAAHSTAPIHLQPLAANGEHIWIGKKTSSYCPKAQVGKACPKGKFTTFAGGEKTLGMGAIVPGGQQVYIDPTCGALQ